MNGECLSKWKSDGDFSVVVAAVVITSCGSSLIDFGGVDDEILVRCCWFCCVIIAATFFRQTPASIPNADSVGDCCCTIDEETEGSLSTAPATEP